MQAINPALLPGSLKTANRFWLALLSACWAATVMGASSQPPRPAPPGPYVKQVDPALMKRTAFPADRPIAGTYYFYWYDDESGAHFINADGSDALTRHPRNPKGYSYKKTGWHRRELDDLRAAGLDFILPIYWGYPNDYNGWSFQGLPPLVQAIRQCRKAGLTCPQVGCFYDTSTLRFNGAGYHADLTTAKGLEWFYITVRDFFALIPPDLWATIDARPLVWLYSANFAAAKNPHALDYLRKAFAADFGVAPFIVKEVSWPGKADATYAWGAALRPNLHSIAAVGPGYDHAAVPGRTPLVKDREGGDFYRRSWQWVLSRPLNLRPGIAVIETWNEWHEGTDIAPSMESGDKYVKLTRTFTDLWHARTVLKPQGPYANKKSIDIVLAPDNKSRGLSQRDAADGMTKVITVQGKTARITTPTKHRGRYIYFEVADSFFWAENRPVRMAVTFLDNQKGVIPLEYDSTDPSAHFNGAFKSSARPILKKGTGGWRTVQVPLPDAAFTGRANGFDFRLADLDGKLVVHAVAVTKE